MGTTGKLEVTSKEISFEWRIPHLFFLQFNPEESCDSPVFWFANASWGLSIYPRVRSQHNSQDYVALCLSRKSAGPPIVLECSLAIKADDGEKYFERQFTCVFDNNKVVEGFYPFISQAELLDRKYVWKRDELIIVAFFTVKESRIKHESQNGILGSSVVLSENKILRDFKELFLQKEDCDVNIKVKGQEFTAHRNILKARSSVLASTFRNDMKEKATGILEIDDCDPSSFSDFLCFLYCGEVNISVENVFDLFTTADKYDVQDLRAKCKEFMKENLSVDTFPDTMAFSLRYSETELIKLSTDFFLKNASKIIVTVKWQQFAAENPTESNELFVKLLVPDNSVSK